MKSYKIEWTFKGGKDGIIPEGEIARVGIEVVDNAAFFRFSRPDWSRKFAESQKRFGIPSEYIERLQKVVCLYKGMTADQILDHLKNSIKELEVKK